MKNRALNDLNSATGSRGAGRRVKLLSPTANAQAEGACGSSAVGPFMRLTARLRGPKLCLSPQPHRVRHELRPPTLATPARHPGSGRPPGRRIAPSLHPRRVGSSPYTTTGPCCFDPAGRRGFRDPQARSGPGAARCIVESASAASCATTTDTPLNAVPSPRDCRTAWDRSRRKAGSPLAGVGPSLCDGFPAAPLQLKSFTYASRKYTSSILLACVRVF
jgi:hypothetical protein